MAGRVRTDIKHDEIERPTGRAMGTCDYWVLQAPVFWLAGVNMSSALLNSSDMGRDIQN
jgi:hypothetical protein